MLRRLLGLLSLFRMTLLHPVPVALLSLWLWLPGCRQSSPLPPAAQAASATIPPELLKFDFGAIPHGETRMHEFAVPLPGPEWIPLAFRAQCSCAVATFSIANRSGTRRKVEGPTTAQHTVQSGETLYLQLAIETSRKEAVDLAKTPSRGAVVLGEARAENRRQEVGVEFTYGIVTPVRVLPLPHVDCGELPRSRTFSQTLGLAPRDPANRIRFSNVRTSRPEVSATLTEKDGQTLLEITYHAGPSTPGGTHAFTEAVLVATDLPSGYEVPIRVSGTVIPDIRVQPFDAIAFGQIDFVAPTEQFVNLHDYDTKRDPGFTITSVVDQNGVECTKHFAARLEAIPGDDRGTRLVLRYLGGLTGRVFRGSITVAKKNHDGPATVVAFHGFNKSS